MDIQEAVVLGAKLGMAPTRLVGVTDLSGHLLDGLRIEFDRPAGMQQQDVNARILASLLDMHARLKELEIMWSQP